MGKILVVEDEKYTADTVELYLEQQGYECIKAYDGQEGISHLLRDSIDLIILDWMLPGLSGLEICQVAKSLRDVKVILLSARSSTSDKVMGLDVGADDYLSKPFSLRELYARIRMLLRDRHAIVAEPVLAPEINLQFQDGVLCLRKNEFTAQFNDGEIPLTLTEFKILSFMAERVDRILTKEDIAAELYGPGDTGNVHTITVHLSNLRAKFRLLTRSTVIRTVHGVGYKLDVMNGTS